MNIFGIVIVIILIVAMVIGCVVGLVKGFTRVKSWGVEFLLASALSIGIGGIFSSSAVDGGNDAVTGGIVTIVAAVACVVVFTYLFKLLRLIFSKLIKNKLEKAKAEGGEYNSSEDDDYVKPKKASAGFIGFLNRIFGGITVALQAFVVVGFVAALLLTALDLSQFAFVLNDMADLFDSATYLNFKAVFMDFFIVGVIMAAVKCGYNSGISGALWSVVVLGLVGFALLASYHLAFNIESFKPAVEKIASLIAVDGADSKILETVAQGIIMAGLFVIMLVAVILIAIFVPKIFNGLRDNKVFFAIDGVFGSIAATVLVVGILLGVGAVLQPISDLEFMAKLTSYFEESKIATYFYDNDLLSMFGVVVPIRDWLV